MNNRPFAFFVSCAVILVFIVPGFQNFPSGSPNVPKVCRDLFPRHSGVSAQTTPPPFFLVTNINNVMTRHSVNVTITARIGVYFKGFIIQARFQDTEPIGTFSLVDPLHSKTLDCLGLKGSTATHSSPVLKKSTSFMWTAPKTFRGLVIFNATVVQNFNTFWTNISMKLRVDARREKEIFSPKQYPLSHLLSENNYLDSGVSQFNRTLYGECGVTKACFGIPEDCVITKSCDALVTVRARASTHEFEMVGIKYVALSISENGTLSMDSMTECILGDETDVRLYQPRYESFSNHLCQTPGSEIQVMKYSFWNGIVYCKFARREDIILDGVRYSFKNHKFFIHLGTNHKFDFSNDNLNSAKFYVSDQKNYLSNVTGFYLPRNSTESLKWYYEVERLVLGYVFGVFYFIPNLVGEYLTF